MNWDTTHFYTREVSVFLVCRRLKRGGDGKEMDSMRKRKEEEEEEEIDRSRGMKK